MTTFRSLICGPHFSKLKKKNQGAHLLQVKEVLYISPKRKERYKEEKYWGGVGGWSISKSTIR